MSANDWMRLVELLLLPPGLILWVGLLIWLVTRARARLLAIFFLGVIVVTWGLSTAVVSQWLIDGLQDRFPPLLAKPNGADAVVVLGGGRYWGHNEYGLSSLPSSASLERMAYGAYLARKWELPLVYSDGFTGEFGKQAAQATRHYFKEVLGVATVYLEENSRTTFENAKYTDRLLEARGLQRPIVVTHYWHMQRALESFHYFGIQASAGPTARISLDVSDRGLWRWLPKATRLNVSYQALHEYGGLLWYHLKLFSNGVPNVIPAAR